MRRRLECAVGFLSLVSLVGALVEGCRSPGQPGPHEVAGTACAQIEETPFPPHVQADDDAVLGSPSICTTAAKCVATDLKTLADLSGKFCASKAATCEPGNCALPQNCRPEARIGTPPTVTLAGCVGAASPRCPAGEVLCKCDLVVPKGKSPLHCGCRCTNPTT